MSIEKIRFIRQPEVLNLVGVSRTTIWRMEKKGGFPKRIKISSNTAVWIESEIHAWMVKQYSDLK
jgi:prophage regulatory protein